MIESARIAPEVDLFHVEPGHVFGIWKQVLPHIESACDDTVTPDEILRWIQSGQASLWVVVDADGEIEASCVHRVCDDGGRRWLDVVTVGGKNFKRWSRELQRALEAAVTGNGCEGMQAECRRGMAKWLAGLGWREHQVRMRWPNGR